MKELDKEIKTFYENKSLSPAQMDKILIIRKTGVRKLLVFKYAAAALFLFGLVYLFQTQFNANNLTQQYAEEVAFNHLKGLTSDIKTNDVNVLNEKMDKLNFDIDLPDNLQKDYTLIGGRYCSIDERIAAQLKLKRISIEEVVTLYVLKKVPKENFDDNLLVGSTTITIWNDDKSLFVLASEL